MYQVNALLKRFQINCKSIGFHSQLEELPYKIDGISVCFPLCFYWNTYDSKLRRYIVCSDSFFQQYNHLRGLVIIERKSKQVTSPHRERSVWSKVNQGAFSNLGSLSNEDNNDNIIKNATSTALHVLCLKHNFFFSLIMTSTAQLQSKNYWCDISWRTWTTRMRLSFPFWTFTYIVFHKLSEAK